MSTEDDHNNLASLQDIFGSNTGYGGYNSPLYGNQGSAGGSGPSGTPGDIGQTIFDIANLATGFQANNAAASANAGLSAALANPTIESLTTAIGAGEAAGGFVQTANTMADIGTTTNAAATIGDVLETGNLGTVGGTAINTATASFPPLGALTALEGILPGPNPIATSTDWLADQIDKVPGTGFINEQMDSLGNAIAGLPGAGTIGPIASAVGNLPGTFLGEFPAEIYKSFKDDDKNEAADRDTALTALFTEENSEGELVLRPQFQGGGLNDGPQWAETPTSVPISDPTGYNRDYSFPYQGPGNDLTMAELYKEFLDTDTGQTMGWDMGQPQIDEYLKPPPAPSPVPYSPQLPPVAGEDYPRPPVIKDEDYPLSPPALTTSQTYEDSKYPPLPETPQSHDPSLPNYIVTPGPIEERKYEPSTADPYQPPAPPQAVKTAPRSWPVERPPLGRVLPEELVTPEKSWAERAAEYRTKALQTAIEAGRKKRDLWKAGEYVLPASGGRHLPASGQTFNPGVAAIGDLIKTEKRRHMPEQQTGRNSSSY